MLETALQSERRKGAAPWRPEDFIDLPDLGRRFRSGLTSCEEVTAAYLSRIDALDVRLGAFTHVARESAMETARAADRMLAAGTDLGPLMGVPVAIKDLYSVTGMPTTAGSNVDVHDLVAPEGPFIGMLKRAGCVILGKTRTTEFAAGSINLIHRSPWNPWDARTQRMTGGSSSGSAVALAADLCAFSVGSDTGGSVRQPAALCGLFGYKSTFGTWPLDGIFPLAPTLDSIGFFTKSAADGALVLRTLTGNPDLRPAYLRGLRLGKPANRFFDGLQPEVAERMDHAMDSLRQAGAEIVPIEIPEVAGSDETFGRLVPAELLAFLGRERFAANVDAFDPVVRARVSPALELRATEYIDLLRRHQAAVAAARARVAGIDAWISPTSPVLPIPVNDCKTVEAVVAWNRGSLRNTQPVNYLGQCAVSMPIHGDAKLPVGFQLACAPGMDSKLMSMAIAVEDALGRGRRPDASEW